MSSKKTSKLRENYRFNRLEVDDENHYHRNFGHKPVGKQVYSGFIKCKLAHGKGLTVIIPDLLFFGKKGERWIQPLAFGPPLLSKFDQLIKCEFTVDVSGGHRLTVHFSASDYIQKFDDGSEFFRCMLWGPANLRLCTTGDSVLRRRRDPLIRLYHHTKEDTKQKILDSGEFWLSNWNIQGTAKKVINVGYVYFTALDRITCDEDLKCIAMSSDEVIHLLVDGFTPPSLVSSAYVDEHREEILPLKVYRGSTADRTATLTFDIDSACLAPQHLLFHTGDLPRWYEVSSPFTHRIGVVPGHTLKFSSQVIERESYPAKHFDYVVVGDASSVIGLAAPYEEETTESIFKIERVSADRNMLEFWFENGNADLFSGKNPELQIFQG